MSFSKVSAKGGEGIRELRNGLREGEQGWGGHEWLCGTDFRDTVASLRTKRRGSHNGCGCPYPCWSYGCACPAVNELRRACIASASVIIGLINNWVLLK